MDAAVDRTVAVPNGPAPASPRLGDRGGDDDAGRGARVPAPRACGAWCRGWAAPSEPVDRCRLLGVAGVVERGEQVAGVAVVVVSVGVGIGVAGPGHR